MESVETSVGEQEDPRGETSENLLGEDDLTGACLANDGVEHCVGRAFGDGHDPGLGEGGLLALGDAGSLKERLIRGYVGDVKTRAIDDGQTL